MDSPQAVLGTFGFYQGRWVFHRSNLVPTNNCLFSLPFLSHHSMLFLSSLLLKIPDQIEIARVESWCLRRKAPNRLIHSPLAFHVPYKMETCQAFNALCPSSNKILR